MPKRNAKRKRIVIESDSSETENEKLKPINKNMAQSSIHWNDYRGQHIYYTFSRFSLFSNFNHSASTNKKHDKGMAKRYAKRKRIVIESDSNDGKCNNITVKKKKIIISDDK